MTAKNRPRRASAGDAGLRRLRLWVGLRILLPLAFLLLAPSLLGDLLARVLLALPYPHGVVKWGLESSQGLLLRQRELPVFVLAGAALPVLLGLLRGRWWTLAALSALLGSLLLPSYGRLPLVLVVGLIVVAGLPPADLAGQGHRLRWVAWIPGSSLLFPGLVAAALGSLRRPLLHRGLMAVAGGLLGFLALWTDCLAHYDAVRAGMERWPDSLLDSRIRVLAHSDPGVRADWHGVEIVGSTAIVVAETTTRLIAHDLDGKNEPAVFDLADRWGPDSSAPLDSETDPLSGLTWVIEGGHSLLELRFDGRRWRRLRAVQLPSEFSYAYLTRDGDRSLMAVAVQTAGPTPRKVLMAKLPELHPIRDIVLSAEDFQHGTGPAAHAPAAAGPQGAVQLDPTQLVDGDPNLLWGLPMPREMAWIPTLQRLVLSPDFGSQLWLADLGSGKAVPWISTPTLDGKMRWSAALDRLVVALPNRLELWVIDPHTGALDWKIPTQPGVRSLAIDDENGLVVTASVLTGQIWVQDIRTGELHRRMGTVMPMVRELALSPERGEGVLSTWVATYAFRYRDP